MRLRPLATIYPYSKDDVQFFRYADLIKEFKPTYPVAPPGWSSSGLDATVIDAGTACGYKISSDLESALAQSQVLVLTSFNEYHGQKGNFAETLDLALQKDLQLIILDPPKNFTQDYLPKLKNSHLKYQIYPTKQVSYLETLTCQKFDVPVVLVFGEGPQTDKFEVQLGLRDELLKKDYQITQIASRNYAEIFGFHSFPDFMHSKEFSETEKILKFNGYLKILEKNENPDLIIVSVPGGMVPITEDVHNNFGILLLEVATAIQPDFVINTLYNFKYINEFYPQKARYNQGKLNAELCCFVLSNTWLDLINIRSYKEFCATKLRQQKTESFEVVDPQTKTICPVVSLSEPNAASLMADYLLEKLETNAAVNFI